jgi:hypothetical protein
MNKRLVHISFFVLFIVLLAQVVVHLTGVFQVRGLNGEIVFTTYQPPTPETFWNGSYQSNTEKSIDVQTALLPLAIRTANQLNYSLFGKYTETVIRTSSDHILQQSYIKAHSTEVNLSQSEIKSWVEEVKAVQQWTEKMGGSFLYILAANKTDVAFGNFGHPRRILNVIDSALAANDIPYFNTQDYLLAQPHDRVFTKNGVHWSIYGATLVVDSLINRINHGEFSIYYEIDTVEMSKVARGSDRDGEELMNLLFPFTNETYEYPVFRAGVNGKKPVFFVFGDSFAWNFYDAGLYKFIAAPNSIYRYYNNTSYDVQMKKLGNMNIPSNPDFVWIVATEANLYEAAFGFEHEISSK